MRSSFWREAHWLHRVAFMLKRGDHRLACWLWRREVAQTRVWVGTRSYSSSRSDDHCDCCILVLNATFASPAWWNPRLRVSVTSTFKWSPRLWLCPWWFLDNLQFHERLLTADNLIKRGIHITTPCILCGVYSKIVAHIFVLCPFTFELWALEKSLDTILMVIFYCISLEWLEAFWYPMK